MNVHFTGFASVPQTITALGGGLIWLCFLVSSLSLAIIFVVFSVWASANESHPVGEEGKTPSRFVLFVAGPILSQNVIVNNIPVEKENISARPIAWRAGFDYGLRANPHCSFSLRTIDVEVPFGWQEPIVRGKERLIVLGWNWKLIRVEQEDLRKTPRYELGWCSAFVSNPEKEKEATWQRFIFYGRYNKPRTLGIKNGLGVQESSLRGTPSYIQTDSGCNDQNPSSEEFWPCSLPQICFCLLVGGGFLFFGGIVSYRRTGFWLGLLGCFLDISGWGCFLLTMIACNENGQQDYSGEGCSQNVVIVPQVISALAEGSAIRQIERITSVHRDTIMRLGVRVGEGVSNG